MKRRDRVAEWFEGNPTSLDVVVQLRAKGGTWSTVLSVLQESHGYPFLSDTAVMRYFARHDKAIRKRAKAIIPSFKRTARDLKKLSKGETFFVTSAVNNCAADREMVQALRHWQGYTGGKVLVNPILYVNPTRRKDLQALSPDVWWDKDLVDSGWMLQDELRPHRYLSIMATKPQATSNNPLPPRIESLTQDRSAIFCHPQIAMRTVATPQEDFPKILYSSGAITEKSYSDTTTGDIAEFHHSIGGVIVEVRGKKFHLREVSWDGKQFIDLDTTFDSKGVWVAPPAEALVMGDIHAPYLPSEDVMEATFGEGGILSSTKAKLLLLHDLFDAGSVNAHEWGKKLSRAARYRQGRTNVEKEVLGVADWLHLLADPCGAKVHVVASNHDDMLLRWLEGGEKNVDPENRAFYHHLSAEMLDYHEEHGEFPNVLELALRRVGYLGGAVFHGIDDSLRIKGVELAMHGHLGPNGARGSAKGLSRIGTRSIIAHSHAPMIWQGVYQVGHSSKARHGYNAGPSSWLTTHALLLANGRRQMVHLIGRDWRG